MPPPSKKRKTAVTAPESITFDPAAREEYLTGFHKRKVARIKLAQEENAKREKEEKVRFRREVSDCAPRPSTSLNYGHWATASMEMEMEIKVAVQMQNRKNLVANVSGYP